jgi:hypothetical protein
MNQQPAQSVKSYESVAEAALDLGHRTYTGTIAATPPRSVSASTCAAPVPTK